MFSNISKKLAKRRADREQRERERQEAREKLRIERHKFELELLSYQLFARHIKCCQGDYEHKEETEDGSRIHLKSFFNPKARDRETVIRVSSPKLRQTLVIIFSHRAVRKQQEWLPAS